MRSARIAAVLTLGLALGCNKGKKNVNGPETKAGPKHVEGGLDDLRIPKVDPKLCDTKDKKVAVFDLNHDGEPDEWKLARVQKDEKGTLLEIPTCKQIDLDHDGNKDWVIHFNDKGMIVLEEFDYDWDGKWDARVHYDDKGRKYLVERQTKHGADFDAWEKYDESGALESMRRVGWSAHSRRLRWGADTALGQGGRAWS